MPEQPRGRPSRKWAGFERRPILKALGAGAALSLGGVAAADEQSDEEESDDGDDAHFVEDLIDPTFGYPLAADETDDVDVEHVVELATVEGEGAHPNFPQGPPGEGGDSSESNGEQAGFPYEFSFDPVGLHVEPGDVVHFASTAGEHTATAFHEKYSNPEQAVPTRVPDGTPGFTSPPIVDGESWLYQFRREGVYDLLCLPHWFFGMVMRVVVVGSDGSESVTAPESGELPPNAASVLSADELAPQNIVDAGEVAWSDLSLEAQQTGSAATSDG